MRRHAEHEHVMPQTDRRRLNSENPPTIRRPPTRVIRLPVFLTIADPHSKTTVELEGLPAAFRIATYVIKFIGRRNGGHWKTGCYWAEEYVTLGCLGCHVTATSQLSRAVNKFVLASVILFKRVNFRQYFGCLRERMLNCCNVLMLS